jgi:class 3 adenylate cyclase
MATSGFKRLSIQSKMILLLLGVSLTSIAAMAWIGYATAKTSLTHAIENQLQGVRVAKTRTLEMMIQSLREQVLLLSARQSTIDAMRDFRKAYRQLGDATLTKAESQKLEDFYRNDFLPLLDKNVLGVPVPEQYLPTRPAERYLQYHYIVDNPNPYEKKQGLTLSSTDTSSYGKAHAVHHKNFTRVANIFGLHDLYLIDSETQDIVYSFQKTTDFGTNLTTGPYANTKMSAQVHSLLNSKDNDDYRFAGFEPFRPDLGKPEGFVMSPVFDGPEMLGILVVEFPIDRFNKVLTGNYGWREEGLGKTGECYLVGGDGTLRSDSRFMHEDPQGFMQNLRQSNIPSQIVDQIASQGTPICALPVDSTSVKAALLGQAGIAKTIGYRGEPVLSAYGPLEMGTIRWAVIAEIDADEADAPIHAFGRTVIIVATGMALAVTLLALISASMLTRPLRLLSAGARRLAAGDTNVHVNLDSHDEFGELGRVFNQMSESISRQTERLENQVRENQELLLNILPASAVAQWHEGNDKTSRQFADVTVLFAKVQGLEELGEQVGETKTLSILCDLIEAFDEAAEESGIEKVRAIGGSYLAACGLSVKRPDHTRRIILFAKEMVRIVGIFNRDFHADLSIAVGINSGPVVGGVVGRRKFLYDLWGDTVIIAKKLAGSQGGAIRVTPQVREHMGEQFQFSGPVRLQDDMKVPELWEVMD